MSTDRDVENNQLILDMSRKMSLGFKVRNAPEFLSGQTTEVCVSMCSCYQPYWERS